MIQDDFLLSWIDMLQKDKKMEAPDQVRKMSKQDKARKIKTRDQKNK